MAVPSKETAVYARNRKAWRKWLEKNHQSQQFAWLIIYHKTADTPSVYYDEAVEEALCFGWIDSKPNKRDAESYYLTFTPRKPSSKWSKLNKERVERLITDGQMMPAGMAMITLAQKTGTWSALEKSDALEIPADLQQLFQKNKKAAAFFEQFPPSAKRGILEWIDNAKRPETRQKRLNETVTLAAQNIRANQYTPK